MAYKTVWVIVAALLITVAAISIQNDGHTEKFEEEFDEDNDLEEYSDRRGKICKYCYIEI